MSHIPQDSLLKPKWKIVKWPIVLQLIKYIIYMVKEFESLRAADDKIFPALIEG